MRYEVNPKKFVTPKVISFDTEYTELNIRKAKLLSVSIGVSPNLTYIFDATCYEELDKVSILLDQAEMIFSWNGIVDWFMISKYSISFDKDKMIDAMLMEHLIDERLNHGLGDFALREANDNYKQEFWKKYETYQQAPKQEAYEYEMRDGVYTFIAGTNYIKALKDRMELVRHVHRLQWALFDTEIKGVKVDITLMQKTKLEMSIKINQYLSKLRQEFNEECSLWELEKWNEEDIKQKTFVRRLLRGEALLLM